MSETVEQPPTATSAINKARIKRSSPERQYYRKGLFLAKALKTVAIVAGVVALVATAVVTLGPILGLAASAVATAAVVASVASLVALTASLGSAALQKKPPSQGSTSQIFIGANLPTPYTMGRTYIGGNLMHDVGYGGTVKDVPNPYRSLVFEYSGAGPVQAIEAFQADFVTVPFFGAAATGYYSGFLSLDTQLGATPESSALAGPYGAIPDWGSTYKMSGHAAALASLKFDKKGKIFASGIPQFGAVLQGVKAYDPRLDSTYPGGSGTQRWADETTWTYSDNPALHAMAYGRGRYQNGKKVMGCGFDQAAVDIPTFVAWANVCDANSWTLGGTIYEPGSRWDNLKRICAAGGALPVFVGARLSVKYNAPKVSLDTIEFDDLADGEYRVPAMKSWRDRVNGIIPKYRSEPHKWEYVQSDLVSVSTYVTEDGEEKNEELQFDLVQNKDQAAKLAAYELVNRREFGPIVLPCKPRMIEYKPGEALTVDIPELGLESQLCIITGREVDPATATVTLTLESETTGKHDFALGQSGTAPPTPTITSGEDMDAVVPKIPDVLPGQLLRDDTFFSRWWNIPLPAGRVEWDDSRNGFAVTVPFVAATDFRIVYACETTLLPRSTEGKALYIRAVLDPNGFSGVSVLDDDDTPIVDTDGAYVVDAIGSDFDLEVSIRWLNADGSFNSRTVIATAVASDGVQTVTGNAVAPVTGFGVIEFGYPSQTGKDGAWTVYEPWEAEYEPTADITAQNQVVVTNPTAIEIAADITGTITGGLPRLVAPTVTRGGVDIRAAVGTTYAIQNDTGGCTGNVTVDSTAGSADKGVQTIGTGFNASGGYDLVVTVDGIEQPPNKVTVTKTVPSSPTGGGGGGGGGGTTGDSGSFDVTGATLSDTTFVEIGRVSSLTKATGQTIRAYFSADYRVYAGGAGRTVTAKWQYSVAGANSWTDFASAVTGTPAYYNNADHEAVVGSVTCNQTAAPSNGSYDIRLIAFRTGGTFGPTFDGAPGTVLIGT